MFNTTQFEWARFVSSSNTAPWLWHIIPRNQMLSPICQSYVPAMGDTGYPPTPEDHICAACIIQTTQLPQPDRQMIKDIDIELAHTRAEARTKADPTTHTDQ